jgi:spore maturation protein CgeB
LKIIIVGSDKIYAIENHYVKYLREKGAEILHFSAQSIFYDYYQRNTLNKLLFRSNLSGIYSTINKQFKKLVENERPDVIWIFKGMEIFPESLEWAKKRRIKLVNYNPDNPFLFSGRGSGNSNITRSIAIYDLHFTYNLAVKKRIESELNIKTSLLPFGFDISDTLYEDCEREEEILASCFLGNPDRLRADFILGMAQAGIEMCVYGKDWNNFISHPGVRIYSPVYGAELWKILRRYRVQLNLMRLHNEDSHNMRTFEVPGVGGIMVAPDTQEHRLFFENEKEVFLFKNVADCVRQTQKLLELSTVNALKIRDAARMRSLNSGYSYKSRSSQALSVLERLVM